jgi:aldose 1-epimerase
LLSGGGTAFSKSAWTVKEHVAGGDSPYITLYYRSFDGEQGFPGSLDAYVTYRLSEPYTLGVHMNAAAPDRATPVNLLLHAYWNLGGHGGGDVLGHTLRLHASRHAVLDGELLPSSGRVEPVAGTPLDFRAPTAIGARIRQVMGGKVVGYDANYVSSTGSRGPCGRSRRSGTAPPAGRWSCGRTRPPCSSTPGTG